jgi:hypothetical protein
LDRLHATDTVKCYQGFSGLDGEHLQLVGHYRCEHRDKDGNLIGIYEAPNLVTDAGAKLLLDTILSGSAFNATTYMGLKGSGSPSVGDVQTSHGGWNEVGNANAPAYSGSRKTVSWSSASGTGGGSRSKASSGTYTYTFTSGGTVDGAFLNINGSSAVDNTTGTLFSAGTFQGGSKAVSTSDQLTVTYSLAI